MSSNKLTFQDILYTKVKTKRQFDFDSLYVPSMYNYISNIEIEKLHNIATSVRYNANINMKREAINTIMTNIGFKRFASGTNRIAYAYLEDQSFIFKVAIDRVGMGDTPAEYYNQNLLKPFCTKVFGCSPDGVVGMVERTIPITSQYEFLTIAPDVFDIIVNKIIGKYVVDDIGTNYFLNWGIRRSSGPCLLDFPYVYELDGNKLYCNRVDPDLNIRCGGVIDYDAGFNNLVCTKCGKMYKAKELETQKKDNLVILDGGGSIMKIKIVTGDGMVYDPGMSSDFIQKPEKKNTHKSNTELKVKIFVPEEEEEVIEEKEVILNTDLITEVHDELSVIKEEETHVLQSKFMSPEEVSDGYEEDDTDRILQEYNVAKPNRGNKIKPKKRPQESKDMIEEF